MDYVGQAFKKIKRKDFVLESEVNLSNIDTALPIGFGQTISQPSTVDLMLNWLDISPGDAVLDIGSGSGYTTALLSTIVGPKGRVFAVEKIPELKQFGENNCKKCNLKNVSFFLAQKQLGLTKCAPYDCILVSASAQEFPDNLINQLKIGGKMVIPVKNDIYEVTRLSGEKTERIKHPGFVFVPLL
jgi:protein-L-isoaspartate(D-aspartate) O-methyltransferase